MNSGPKANLPPPVPQRTPDIDESLRKKRRKIKARTNREDFVIGLSVPNKGAPGLQVPKGGTGGA